jgi:phosphohistidine phosphatase
LRGAIATRQPPEKCADQGGCRVAVAPRNDNWGNDNWGNDNWGNDNWGNDNWGNDNLKRAATPAVIMGTAGGGGQVSRGVAGCIMRQLLLLRHAKSASGDASVPDRDRPLNASGRRSAGVMRSAMRDLGLAPDVVLVSTARRTLETLEALEPWDDTPLVEPMDSLYLANPIQLTAALHGVAETVRSVLVIGHNPGLHDLALALAGARALAGGGDNGRALAAGFPTGALAEFVVAGSWWDLREGGGKLVRFLTPRMLGDAGSQ